MKKTFFSRYAGLILLLVAFLVPFAMRGARLSVERMKNDVKDWLPSGFRETQELDWFRHHFVGEQFVLVSWDGCAEGDERLELMTRKLIPFTPPASPDAKTVVAKAAANTSQDATSKDDTSKGDIQLVNAVIDDIRSPESAPAEADADAVSDGIATDAEAKSDDPAVNMRIQARTLAEKLGLFTTGKYYENWGGAGEKWLKGDGEQWYFIKPDGAFHQWDGDDTMLGAAVRVVTGRNVSGAKKIAQLDAGYHSDPRRATAALFKTVTSGPQLLEKMTRDGGSLASEPDEALARLTGTLFGPDGKQTCLMVTLTDHAKKNLHRVLGRGLMGKPRGRLFELADECGITTDNLHLGGPPVDNVAIDEEGTITLVRLVGLCIVLGVFLSYSCFRSIKATIMVFFLGGISAIASLSLVWWCGGTVDAVLMSMPALIYVLGISGAVHIMNYYREAVEQGHLDEAPGIAVRHAWKPAVLCSITTAFGLLSLYTSDILPIRKFGVYSALGVMVTLVLLFTFLPAALHFWPLIPKKKPQAASPPDDTSWLDRLLAKFWDRLGSFIIRHHVAVSVLSVLTVVGVGWGINRMKTTVQLIKMFDGGAKIIHDYQWLESNVGKLIPIELVVRIDEQMQRPALEAADDDDDADETDKAATNPDAPIQLTFLERMEIVDRVQKVVESRFGERGTQVVGRTMSAATFAPSLPKARGDIGTMVKRGATNGRLEAHREEFLGSDYLRIDDDRAELWRISVRLGAFNNVDYGLFVAQLKGAVEPVMAAYVERERILRELTRLHGQEGYVGARVYLWGVPQAEAVGDWRRAQTETFAATLYDLLRIARLKVDGHGAEGDVPADWAKKVAAADCVVLVDPTATADLDQIERHAQAVVDARGHHFDEAAPVLGERQRTPTVSTVYTGVVPVVYKAQRTLLESLVESTFWSFATITPVMMFVAWSIPAGIVAMLPNVFPVFIIFGAMGWLEIEVDIGSMMTASIALGVAVDDTIHFLTWFRRDLNAGMPRKQAILGAYRHCATPTFQTALISGLGLSIFAFSTFTPTQRFGYLMLAILACGMVAELILFPALLAGPLGRVFKPTRPKTPAAAGHDQHGTPISAPTAEPHRERRPATQSAVAP